MFPDQFGRIHSLKIDAEHFIEQIEKNEKDGSQILYPFYHNPFNYDIAGKKVDFESFSQDNNKKT